MTRLDEAWAWYAATHHQLRLVRRLGERYWDELPWAGRLGLDDSFRGAADPEVVVGEATTALDWLNDLAVVVLFSAFETLVRDHAVGLLRGSRSAGDHPVVAAKLQVAEDDLREGSFYRLLDAYKAVVDKNLVELVNQVRKYRNWVAHGRREGDAPDNVAPKEAFDRLAAFLAALGIG